MKPRHPSNPPAPAAAPPAPGTPAPRRSGRVQFDSRGQAVWEWAVKTGMFDRNASTQRIKALVETPLSLSEDPKPAPDGQAPKASTTAASPSAAPTKPTEASSRRGGGNPYERAEPVPKLQPGENTGFDPYSSGPSRPRGSR